ncbi:hypothetical protein KAJ61_02715 [Candidatus Parcubacteria bacterium]|nr:hypothetical protein [Candidatus Parcubacteria bacterium]
MNSDDLKALINSANEAVKDIKDDELKKIAFKIALDKLLYSNNSTGSSSKTKKVSKTKNVTAKKTSSGPKSKNYTDDLSKELCKKINRTKYPKIHNLKTAKERAVYILKIAKNDLNADGLNPTQISLILSGPFRIKASKESISMALGSETKFVDRKEVSVKGGKAYVYKLMHKGEEWIDEILKNIDNK